MDSVLVADRETATLTTEGSKESVPHSLINKHEEDNSVFMFDQRKVSDDL